MPALRQRDHLPNEMIPIFTKPLERVTAADVAELIAKSWPEGYEVEFKTALPDRKGGVGPWAAGKNEIGDYARDEILSEVVALANAQGGTVVLGVDETRDKPARASAITPLRDAGDLARRFEDQGRSCIDPPLPRLQVHPIETDGTGGGVVIFRVPASRSAPHRLTTSLHSYIRRGSSTVKMTMREIQDMTLNVARGAAGIDAVFAERQEAFRAWGQRDSGSLAVRVTAYPLVPIPDPGRIFRSPNLFPGLGNFVANVGGASVHLPLTRTPLRERPVVRGAERYTTTGRGKILQLLHQSGLSDLWLAIHADTTMQSPSYRLPHGMVLSMFANMLNLIETYRGAVGAPGTEYGIEVSIELLGAGYRVDYVGLFDSDSSDAYHLTQWRLVLPRMSVGPSSEFDRLVNVFDMDIYDALGSERPPPPPMTLNW